MGINCALGPEQLRPYLQELSQISPVYVSCYPNAGLPNAFGGFDETPEQMARTLAEYASNGWLNLGGEAAAARHHRTSAPSPKPCATSRLASVRSSRRLRTLSGLEMFTLRPDSNFTMIGERTNVTGSKKFARMILAGQFEDAVGVARGQVEGGRERARRQHGRSHARWRSRDDTILNLLAADHDVSRVPIMVDSSKWSVIEAGLRCVQGKGIVNSISLKEGEEQFLEHARLARRYGAAVVVMAFDEKGQATSKEDKVRICQRAYKLLIEKVGFPPTDIIFDPNILTVATGIEEHNRYAINFIEAVSEIKRVCPGAKVLGGRQQYLVLVSRQRRRTRSHARRVFVPRDSRRARYGDR